MSPSFVLIRGNDLAKMLSINGVIQLGIITLAILIAMFGLTQFKLRKSYAVMLQEAPIKAGIMTSVIPTVLFFAISLLLGEIYSLISDQAALLTRSLALLSLVIGMLAVVTFLIDKSFAYDKKYSSFRVVIKVALWVILIAWVTDFDNILAVKLSKVYVDFGSSRVQLWEIVSTVFYMGCAIGGVLWAIAIFDNIIIVKFTTLEENEKSLIQRLFKIFAIFVSVYIVLPTFGVNLTGLSVLGGGIGVGIGLGLQKIASNFISGFIILIDKSVKIGDRVVINGITGTITEITTRYTVMEAFDGSEVIIPNEQFMTNTVINQTHSNQDIGLELTVSVGYSSDLRKVLELVNAIIAKHPLVNQDKGANVSVKNLNESGIDIFIRLWPLDALKDTNTIRNDINIAIVEQFRENNIEIPFPKVDVTLLK